MLIGNELLPAGRRWARSELRLLAICPFAPGVSKGIGKLWGRLQSPIGRWWFISFDLLRVKPLLGGFPVFSVTLAGISHGRVCTPGRLRRRGAMLRETPPPPPAGDLLSCFAKKEGKEGDPASPVGLRPTPLLVRGSKVQTGFQRTTEPLLMPHCRSPDKATNR